MPKLKLGRGLALVVEPQQGVDVKPYAVGLVSGGVLFGLGRYISNNNRPDENRKDFGSQEFREDAMNEGIVEAAAGGLEWGGCAWSVLSVAQLAERFYSKSPFLANIGAPRVVLLIMGAACAGFAIRGEERLIGSARKALAEKAKAQQPQ